MQSDEDYQLLGKENEMKRINIKVGGITCTGCALDIKTVLENTEGIFDADVSYASEAINIDYDPEEINENRIMEIVKRLGLKVL